MTGPVWFKDQCQPAKPRCVQELHAIAAGLINYLGIAAGSRRVSAAANYVERVLADKDARIAELERQLARSSITHEREPFRHERDGHPSFRAELAKAASIADSCYERSRHEVYHPTVLGSEAEEAV